MLPIPDNLILFHCLGGDAQYKLFHHLLGTDVRVTAVSCILFLALFEDWSDTGFSPLFMHFCHSSKCFKDNGELFSNPFQHLLYYLCMYPIEPHLCAPSLPRSFMTRFSSTKEKSSFPQSISLSHQFWDSQGEVLMIKYEEKTFSDFTFSVSSIIRALTSFSSKPTFFLVFLLLLTYLKKLS